MKLVTKKLSININSTLDESLDIQNESNDFSGWRVSGYIKGKLSDKKVLASLDVKFVPENQVIRVYLPSSRAANLKVGQIFYFIELVKGVDKITEYNYLSVYP